MRSLTLALLLACACDGPTSPPPATPPAPAAQPAPAPAPATPPAAPATPPATAPKTPPKTPSATPPKTPPDEGDDNPGFADPKTAAGDEPAPATPPKTAEDPALAAKITKQFGERCKLERSCGDLLGVDCQSAVDGPYYYVQRRDLKTVATCGGACRRTGCTDCPPKAWTCPTY
ncbi:MAG TPA: hypothetical protein VGB85_13925 [Nannocystis sp.]|jgi:hypothetical protein